MNTFLMILSGTTLFVLGWGYCKSPTWKDKLRLTLVLVSIAISILFMLYIIKCWGYFVAGDSLKTIQFKSIYHLPYVFLFIIEYLLIGSIAVTLAAWIKKGYANLKCIKKESLFWGLLVGLLSGLFWGLLVGLLVGGLLVGLLVGLSKEFKK